MAAGMSERADGLMPQGSAMARFGRLGLRRQLLLLEASLSVSLTTLAVQFLPFSRSVRISAHPLRQTPVQDANLVVEKVRWAVEAAARNLPWRIVCFQKGLAAQSMLRRRGHAAKLHYGVQQSPDGILRAHVWVGLGTEQVIGGDESKGFSCVAVFPADCPREGL
jgi:hypothetical protein